MQQDTSPQTNSAATNSSLTSGNNHVTVPVSVAINDVYTVLAVIQTSEDSRFQQLAISDEMFEAHLSDIESQLSNLDIPVAAVFYEICSLSLCLCLRVRVSLSYRW